MKRISALCVPAIFCNIKMLTEIIDWITPIPFEEWPQQSKLADGNIRPAMVTDLDWKGFGTITDGLVDSICKKLDNTQSYNRMLSVVMPEATIEAHRDRQPDDWLARVHVPLLTNDFAFYFAEGNRYQMKTGIAYLINTEAMHDIANEGKTPRIHLMFDLR